jgi:hypothetical protein
MNARLPVRVVGAIALVAAATASSSADVASPALRSELLERAEIDQTLRSDLDLEQSTEGVNVAWRRVEVVDHGNTAWLRRIVDHRGWPSEKLVGEDGAHAAWLLVQHADADPAFQRRCLDLIEAIGGGAGASARDVAYLTDRVRIAEGRPQLYGSQLRGGCDHGFTPHPIEDEVHVDERRAQKGLQSLGEYLVAAKGVMCRTSAP